MFSLTLLGLLLSFDYDVKLVGVHGCLTWSLGPGLLLSDQSARLIYLLTQEPSSRPQMSGCYGSPRYGRDLLPDLVHGDDALRLNATVPLQLATAQASNHQEESARPRIDTSCPMLDGVSLPLPPQRP